VLAGSASELERDLPFWIFADALDAYVRALDPRRLGTLDTGVRSELAQVLPAFAGGGVARAVAIQSERYRAHRAVAELLELLAATKPVVLVLDDLHWADAASAELVGALLRRPPAAPVLLALAVRPRQVPQRLAAALERAHRTGALQRVELGPLSLPEARELLGASAGGDRATALYEECGGNPFYLEQIARAPAAVCTGASEQRALALDGVTVPPMVAAALGEELMLVSAGGRRVLDASAVAGDPFEPEVVAAIAAMPEATMIEGLDELLTLDLVRPTDVPRRFRFRHPLVRRAVYEGTPAGWRLGAHERAAAALAARGASAAARAHHLERSARSGDLAAVAVLCAAGESAAQRAPASAARWFAAALRVLPETAPADERLELLLARSEALAATGQFADSHELLLECARIAPAGTEAQGLRVTAACVRVEHLLGRHDQAHARLSQALAELGDPDSAVAVAVMIELAVDSMYRTEYDEMRGWATRAGAAADGLDAPELTAAAIAIRAVAGALSGTVDEARAHRAEAARLIDALADDVLARRLDALAHLATAEMYLDRFDASGRHAERALKIGRATGQGDLFPLIFPMLGTALWVQGRVRESGDILDGAVEAARLIDNVQGAAWNLYNRSFAAFAAGDIELAIATARESIELARELDESVLTGHVAWALAAPLLEIGDAEQAAHLLLTRTGGEELRVIPGGWRAVGLELLTRVLLTAGRREDAQRAAAAASACADAVGLPLAAAMALLAEAAIALHDGDPTCAAERSLDAAAIVEEVGAVFYAAVAWLRAGQALGLAGDRDTAAAELGRAAAAFERFGSPRYRDKAEQELRRLGIRVGRRRGPGSGETTGVASLTARELEIARLVVDRKTNTEIAAELFLSTKTIETHLRNVFHKLGVSSRVEVARAVERAERDAG
jgi:DNA-binding CsgD family transcriptional regulator